MRRSIVIFLLIVLLSSILACGSTITPAAPIVSSATPVPEQPQDVEPTVAPEQPAAPAPTDAPAAAPMAKLGETAELAGMSLSAVQVADPATPSIIYQPADGMRLVAVEVIVGNVSAADPVNVNPLNFTLVDADGFTYKAELGGPESQIELADLAVGEKIKGWVGFNVPKAAVLASIKFQPNMFDTANVLQVGLTP